MRRRPVQNRIIELHDSTVGAISRVGNSLVVEFRPAYVHSSDGRPGLDPGTGWAQDADLVIREADCGPTAAELPAWISDGELIVGEERFPNVVPIPLDRRRDEVQLDLVMVTAETFSIRGRGVELKLLGDARFIENFRPK